MRKKIERFLRIPVSCALVLFFCTASISCLQAAPVYEQVTHEAIGLPVIHEEEFGGVYAGLTIEEFNDMGFSYGDSVTVSFSNGYSLEDIPYYNGYYTLTGDPLVVACMITYANYYDITKDSDPVKYKVIVENVLNPMIQSIISENEDFSGLDLEKIDLSQCARDLLVNAGMEEEQILLLIEQLTTTDTSETDADIMILYTSDVHCGIAEGFEW